ncbi:class I poly(R)-hydroxyalkanoic acid synthase [Legionella taurinensis]|uniref:Class I poly(R)-hydroxyalkanoic acid synthase n=1 Tax=Legionella taurinensis TaxID=70611 RepID=A0AB38N306_9GAMM|nr:class I poly(R)-hydroxyalkanoic acid synthase [Legionella taurinensis]MDX1837874.1 class I poly(R)-hydroxyalkanoic acid synthase [Legionella taurinensis]PUT39624.1 class I poly(R)-hydroxyalkanoic acid synthase [Legionella taurinensis]PUT43319.1 class I poly(R)-hydroxyalkanoic acid synthase [Legionella taurinensis]PUT45764.1 class I poly(R)-hydroxyalkanoic acid synthase [Legionella taurinensis]PUT47677.1 class I poly(R)-hydroxyalkanoic acid synthase [Legionella taurinensis]
MTHDAELSHIMQVVAEKSLKLMTEFQTQPTQVLDLIKQYSDVTNDFISLMLTLLKNPEQVWQMQVAYWKDAMSLAQDQFSHWLEGKAMPIDDKRFSGEEWVNNPFFNLLSQHYLLASEHMNCLLEQIDYGDKQLAKRIQFFTRQYLDALSPANYLHTNPQLMAETIQSHGKNLLKGLQNLLTDMESGSTRLIIKMTDTDAFKIGENLATTPGKVIFRNDMMELIQYSPQTEKVNSIPLLIIPPWINKYYILDLSPHNSFVKWIVEQGITVFMISWVNPDASYANKGLYNYLDEGPMTAIDIIRKQLKVKKVNTLGFCIGGTLLACLLAYYNASKTMPVHSATFLASMIDFSDPGDISVFIDEHQIARLEEQMKLKGYLDGRFMASTFNSLRANDLVWSFFIKNYLQGKNPVPFDILYWNADATNMPAKMHSTYLRWMYLHNYLVKPGKVLLNHVPIDVTQITIPTFFVSTLKDHIAPWKTTYKGFELMKGKKRFLLGGSGHIAGIVNPPNVEKYGYYRNYDTHQTADEWFNDAMHLAGSWWPEWMSWLKKESGRMVEAPVFSELPYPGIVNAPGTYVFKTYTSEVTTSPAATTG